MEQDIRDILREFGSKFYLNEKQEICYKETAMSECADELVKLCNLYNIRKRASNKWHDRGVKFRYFIIGAALVCLLDMYL